MLITKFLPIREKSWGFVCASECMRVYVSVVVNGFATEN